MSPGRFPPAARLRRSAEFKRVFAEGLRVSDGLFTIVAGPSTQGRPRLGLAVSRRCARSAVQRNRLKRLIRESFRHHCKECPVADYVVMCRSRAAGQPNSALLQSLDRLWDRMAHKVRRDPA